MCLPPILSLFKILQNNKSPKYPPNHTMISGQKILKSKANLFYMISKVFQIVTFTI